MFLGISAGVRGTYTTPRKQSHPVNISLNAFSSVSESVSGFIMIYFIQFGMIFGALSNGKAMPVVSSWKPLQPPMAEPGLIFGSNRT